MDSTRITSPDPIQASTSLRESSFIFTHLHSLPAPDRAYASLSSTPRETSATQEKGAGADMIAGWIRAFGPRRRRTA